MPVKYIPGKLEHYTSTKSFQLGNTRYNVLSGTEILFDGTNVEINGTKFVLSSLRVAIKLGWIKKTKQNYNRFTHIVDIDEGNSADDFIDDS